MKALQAPGPSLYPNAQGDDAREPIVLTGIGLIASTGGSREELWRAVQRGESGVRRVEGLPGIPDGLVIAAPVDLPPEAPGELKVLGLLKRAASEAAEDADIDFNCVDPERFACAVSGHIGDVAFIEARAGFPPPPGNTPFAQQWLPNTGCWKVADMFGLRGPRICHSCACASGLVDIVSAMRAIEDGQCDIALAGSAEALHPLFVAGFRAMRVLARHDDPTMASRPFDSARNGFVMGEGAAMLVIERLSHAVERGATIYAELAGARLLAEAHHVTGLDAASPGLVRLIRDTLKSADLPPEAVDYVNAHGTGTLQNDVMEIHGIRGGLGAAADSVSVSSTKSMLGHLINAAGSVELAITALALRDGFAPPTINLHDPDPACDVDCVPLVGRTRRMEHALKISVAFGGHLAAVALRRWPGAQATAPSRRLAA